MKSQVHGVHTGTAMKWQNNPLPNTSIVCFFSKTDENNYHDMQEKDHQQMQKEEKVTLKLLQKKKRDPKTKTRATMERHSSSNILLWECLRAPESRPIIPWFHSSYSQSGSFSYTFKLGKKKKNLPDHCSSCSTDTNNSLPLKIESRLIWTRLLRSCHRWCHVLF